MNAAWWLALVLSASAGGNKDSDGDGVIDKEDLCKAAPEDLDGFQDSDGCPEVDNDRDGLIDDMDQCPNEPEDVDGFQDGDGCPDADAEPPKVGEASERPLQVLTRLDAALEARDAERVRGLFLDAGWKENLFGPSGLPGVDFAAQGIAKGWALKATELSLEEIGERQIVWCKVVDRATGNDLDAVWVVLAPIDGGWKVLAAGEDEEEARALASKKGVDPEPTGE